MIVDFTVSNYRSFKSAQLFSLHAENKPKYHGQNVMHSHDDIALLRSCGLYGANAAGKSNLIAAIEALKYLVLKSAHFAKGDEIEVYDPYLLDDEGTKKPVCFDIEFVAENNRFSYQIEFTKYEIVYEKLSFYPNNRAANLFERTSSTDFKNVKFGERFKGGKKRFGFFANNSYLSKAGYSPESPALIQGVFDYFRHKVHCLPVLRGEVRSTHWQKDASLVSIINTFLNKVDLGIEGFAIEEKMVGDKVRLPDDMPEEIKHALLEEHKMEEVFYHRSSANKSVRFERTRESDGTLRMFGIMPVILLMLKKGNVLFIDEIESSLHPHIAELVIKLFNDPAVNINGAQLIYTTHDVSLMSSHMLRKDQIYFVEKSVNEGSQLYNLESFDSSQLKDTSPFSKWYNEGRLGAVPSIDYNDIADAIRKE